MKVSFKVVKTKRHGGFPSLFITEITHIKLMDNDGKFIKHLKHTDVVINWLNKITVPTKLFFEIALKNEENEKNNNL